MKKEHFSVRALFSILIVPILIAILTIVLVILLPPLSSYGLNLPLIIVLVSYPSFIYFYWLFHEVSYSDTRVLDMVDIRGAPEEVANQLKTISKNRLVNVEIILF